MVLDNVKKTSKVRKTMVDEGTPNVDPIEGGTLTRKRGIDYPYHWRGVGAVQNPATSNVDVGKRAVL